MIAGFTGAHEWAFGPQTAADPGADALHEADEQLARLGRFEARARLHLGELLDALFTAGGHHELGFSSERAYVLERCGQKDRWARETRALARRLKELSLHRIRHAIVCGRITFSMAELLARHATAETEAELLAEAEGKTLSAMKSVVTARAGKSEEDVTPDHESERVCLRREVGPAELLMLHASRPLVEYLNAGAASDEALLTALLGEAETTLLALDADRSLEVSDPSAPAMRELRLALRPHSEPEADPSGEPRGPSPPVLELIEDRPLPSDVLSLDAAIVAASRALAGRNLEMGRLARSLFARGWYQLGYRSPAEYARERVGVSLSTLEHRVTLARRASAHRDLEQALVLGEIGVESAMLVGQVLDKIRFPEQQLVQAWVNRARLRTVVHLREEVNAVLILRDLDPQSSLAPPDDAALEEVAELERKAQSGELYRSLLGAHHRCPQISVTLHAGHGRELRLHVSEELYRHLLHVEKRFRQHAGPKASFVAFMCFSLWSAWLPYLQAYEDKWQHIYRRDRHRCTSPTCDRHDVTPHHLRFQSHGGGHEDENLTSLCSWCHLYGIHEGRLKAAPPASNIHWWIGRTPILEVRGREKAEVRGREEVRLV